MMSKSPIPIVSLAHINENPSTSLELRDATSSLNYACREFGCFYLTGTGIPNTKIKKIIGQASFFFNQSTGNKDLYEQEASIIGRGYHGLDVHGQSSERNTDIKESFFVGVDREKNDPLVIRRLPNHGPNVWPNEINMPCFRSTVEDYFLDITQVAHKLLRLFAFSLNMPANYFEPYIDNTMATLRLLSYQQTQKPHQPIIFYPHEDHGLISIILQNNTRGLEVASSNGSWISADPIKDTLFVNVGKVLSYWTNSRYKASLHRVISSKESCKRISLPFFFDGNYDAKITPIPLFNSLAAQPNHPKSIGNLIYGDFNTNFNKQV